MSFNINFFIASIVFICFLFIIVVVKKQREENHSKKVKESSFDKLFNEYYNHDSLQ